MFAFRPFRFHGNRAKDIHMTWFAMIYLLHPLIQKWSYRSIRSPAFRFGHEACLISQQWHHFIIAAYAFGLDGSLTDAKLGFLGKKTCRALYGLWTLFLRPPVVRCLARFFAETGETCFCISWLSKSANKSYMLWLAFLPLPCKDISLISCREQDTHVKGSAVRWLKMPSNKRFHEDLLRYSSIWLSIALELVSLGAVLCRAAQEKVFVSR